MSIHLQREIERLKKNVLALSAQVEENLGLAVTSLLERDVEAARDLRRRDLEVDRLEVEVEEECLKTLALHQPVAIDLRFIVACLKINNDLERIGDLAVSIANKAVNLVKYPPLSSSAEIAAMAEKAQAMVHDVLEAFVNMNCAAAYHICGQDNEVDRMKSEMRRRCEEMVKSDPALYSATYSLMGAVRNLERVADHATNIAEDVIYMVEGKIIRHNETE